MNNKQENMTRVVAYEILYLIYYGNGFFDNIFENFINKYKLNKLEKKYIYNLVLTSIRNHIKCQKIIKKFSKRKVKVKSKLLLIIAITQILFFKTPNYAVVNTTVNIAKNLTGVNPSFINAILRMIIKKLDSVKLINTNFSDLPQWFKNETKDWSAKTKEVLLKSIDQKPSIHIVLKNKNDLSKFQHLGMSTTPNSFFIKTHNEINKIPYYEKGIWWVQDFSVMLPIYLLKNIENSNVIDMCAAPGGKSLQLLSKKANVDIYEKNKKRIPNLKKNLLRCGFNTKIYSSDVLNSKQNNYYDIVILDAPCSSIGTVRRNPEILFKKNFPNFNDLSKYQYKLLEKASNLVSINGIILYMVCSFFKKETTQIINQFLKNKKNFAFQKFSENEIDSLFLNKKGQLKIIPSIYKGEYFIDGFFASILKKKSE